MFPHPQNIWILVLVYLYLEEGRRLIVLLCFNLPQTEKKWGWRKTGSYKPFSLKGPTVKHSLFTLKNLNYLVGVFSSKS